MLHMAHVCSGSLLVRQLGDLLGKADLLNTEYISTLLVVVPKCAICLLLSSPRAPRNAVNDWNSSYENLCDLVVPRSSLYAFLSRVVHAHSCDSKITEDSEFVLFSVKLFKRVVDDFRNAAREKRYGTSKVVLLRQIG